MGENKERRRGREEGEQRKKKKTKKVIRPKCTFQLKHTETPRNFTRGGMGGCLILVCIPVRDFPSVPAGTEYTTMVLDQIWMD